MKEVSRTRRLREHVELEFPEFADMVKGCDSSDIVMHQDAFAAGFNVDDYERLGRVIKYAGLHGKNVHVVTAK